MPLSAVHSTPLPFLNRFEKYILTLHSALTERLSVMHSQPRLPYTDSSVWRAVWAGVEDFAARLVAPVSLPGFVPGETIAALILRAIDDSAGGVSGAIVLRGSSAHLDVAGIDDGCVTFSYMPIRLSSGMLSFSQPRGSVALIIRLINFQLLQLARPECIQMKGQQRFSQLVQGLPEPYLREFVERQEHFSAANLIRTRVAAHWRKRHCAVSSRANSERTKLIIFTRTDSSIARLGMGTDTLLSIVRIGADDAFASSGCTSNDVNPTSSVCVLQLRDVSSSEELTRRIGEAISDAEDRFFVLFVLADMSVVTARQLNFARQQVSECICLVHCFYDTPLWRHHRLMLACGATGILVIPMEGVPVAW